MLISKSMLILVKVLKEFICAYKQNVPHFFHNLLIFHRAVSLLFISNRFETSLFTGKTSVFSSAGQRALSSAELGAFIRASYRPKTFLSTFQIGIEHRGTPSSFQGLCVLHDAIHSEKTPNDYTRLYPSSNEGNGFTRIKVNNPSSPSHSNTSEDQPT